MSNAREPAASRASFVVRVARAAASLSAERRLAAVAAIGLFLTLFLPWYSQSVSSATHLAPVQRTFTGWQAFSWVEAALLVVAGGVLVLLFRRAEGRAFHLPGGDGTVIVLAGGWTGFLVIWRMFDKQGVTRHGQLDVSSGIEWGIFAAFAAAALLTYAGTRIRAARAPEPPLATEDGAVFDGRWRRADGSPELPSARAAGDPEPARASAATAVREPARAAPRRSAWRPAEAPEWSERGREGDRQPGWLSRRPERESRSPDEQETAREDREPGEAPTELRSRTEPGEGQLRIPFGPDDTR